jgi:hypothetical protein
VRRFGRASERSNPATRDRGTAPNWEFDIGFCTRASRACRVRVAGQPKMGSGPPADA